MSAIKKAVSIVGGQVALASHLGIKPNLVWNWIHLLQRAPAKHIIAISRATNGKVSVNELLSDHIKHDQAA